MTDRNMFYITAPHGQSIMLNVLERERGPFHSYEIDIAGLARLMEEIAPHLRKAIIPEPVQPLPSDQPEKRTSRPIRELPLPEAERKAWPYLTA